MLLRVIGDCHGLYERYARIIKNTLPSIQLGDMGVGFIRYGGANHGSFAPNPPHQKMVDAKAEFIRGNHDNTAVCKRHSQYIPDGTVRDNMFFLGGAVSIDRAYRIRDYSWWHDEELSYAELQTMISVYEAAKPEIVLSHECPEHIAHILCAHIGQKYHYGDGSRTRIALQQMNELHKPKLHIFGHWHYSFDMVIDDTRFICLNELEWMVIDTETFDIINRGQG